MQVYDHVEEEIRDNPLEPSGWHQIRKAQRTLFRPVRDQDGRHHQVVSEWYITLTRAD
jgi:hypothetical protein